MPELFHNEYLYPKRPTVNPLGVPGKLAKGQIFALRQPPQTNTPNTDDDPSTGDLNEEENAGPPPELPADAEVPDLGAWNSFPTNIEVVYVSPDDLREVAGNYYEDYEYLSLTVAPYFFANSEGEYVDLEGTPMPEFDEDTEDSDRAAWYLSVLVDIPQWKKFTDGATGLQYIYHLLPSGEGQEPRGFIEGYEAHESLGGGAHKFSGDQSGSGSGNTVPNPTGTGSVSSKKTVAGSLSLLVDYNRFKTFQFNPASWEFVYQMMGSAPSASLSGEGTANVSQAPGFVNTSVALAFNRTAEVYAATMGTNPKVDEVFGRVGVQQDIFELFRIMMDPTDYNSIINPVAEDPATEGVVVPEGTVAQSTSPLESMGDLNTVMFDIGMSGASISFSPVAIVFNDYFTIQGFITSVTVLYAAFNNRLVPTIASVTLGIEVLNVAQRDSSTLLNQSATQLIPGATSLSSSVPASGGGTSGRARVVSRSSLLEKPVTRPGTSVSYSAT